MKKLLLITSVGVVALLGYTALVDDAWTEYVRHQEAYKAILSQGDQTIDYSVGIKQIVLPKLDRIDRCVSCHVALEDPRMADAQQPLRTHPGTLLATHDIQKVGCTVCHGGQGRALTKLDAHANRFPHWEKKRLTGQLVQANCARCHQEDSPAMGPQFVRGRDLFRSKGCLGCHKLNGRGGHLGPELTKMGDASTHMKMPTDARRHDLVEKFNGNVNLAYIYESIMWPKDQPTDSKMFETDLSESEALALTVYIKSFANSSIPGELQYARDTAHVPDGEELYATYCSACHGADGMGTRKDELDQIAPAVAHEAFLAIADPQFVYDKTYHSGNPAMPAWGKAGGFTEQEIRKVSDYIFSLQTAPPTLATVGRVEGNSGFGKVVFSANCASCHGIDGSHETDLVGTTLDSPEFRSYADRDLMYRTIANGRARTAMPSWSFLSDRDYADLLDFLESKDTVAVDYAQTVAHTKADGGAKWGKARFASLCGSCHGMEAEGGIGPSLNSPEFKMLASDRFLYDTITVGRRGTAMGRWDHLTSEEIGWLMAYVRSTTEVKAQRHYEAVEVIGSESKGRITFAGVCAQCHGPAGSGHIAPAIGNRDFLLVAGDDFIKETAAYGRTGTGMKGNLKGQGGTASLDERQINSVVAYLRSMQDEPQLPSGSLTQGDISLGRENFARLCAQCHGPAGSGGKGPGIGREGFLSHVPDGFILGTVANGRTGTEMKGFTQAAGGLAELDGHNIRSIVAYLRSGADQSKIQRVTVDGTAANGEQKYQTQCAQCHGTWEKKSFAPHLTNKVFLDAASDAYLQATMALGRRDTAMRPMMRGGGGVVGMTSKEVNDLISYLRQSAKNQTEAGRK